jgi:hypothetical protein
MDALQENITQYTHICTHKKLQIQNKTSHNLNSRAGTEFTWDFLKIGSQIHVVIFQGNEACHLEYISALHNLRLVLFWSLERLFSLENFFKWMQFRLLSTKDTF